MTELPAYVVETLWEDQEFVLSRRISDEEGSSLLVCTPASTQPTVETVARLHHAYALRDELDSAWAARPVALERRPGRSALLTEDPGGEVLARMVGKPWDLTPFLRVAIGLAAALGRLHSRGLVHKDVKPSNVLVNIDRRELWLLGFGIASRVPRERRAPEPPEIIAGTLAYMAPEQTGRMNRSTDARSDLYSLGVTLYEMLTGALPFTASDPMELIHCHIARQPMPPEERANGIPAPVAAIVMKLLAKTAEDRYQTAAGVAYDLEQCLKTWEGHRCVDPFPLGSRDVSDRLLISEKLYGREAEIDALLAAFDRVVSQGRTELVLVSGYSGIGKSSVVNELHKVLVPPRGLFASGKFDQYKRDIPYATLAQALQSLVRQLLSKNDAELARWRTALLEALGANGSLIVDLIPELSLIVGEQPPVADLPPQEAQARFQQVFRRFLGVFARAEHPLALFLDDLQWLDRATLDLIEHLSTHPEVRHLLLVGAYRDNEVGPTHALVRTLGAIRSARGRVREIVLEPLKPGDVGQLVGDALHCDPVGAQPLVQLVHEKTGGNPFFTIQFLTVLAEEALLAFDHGTGAWTWDMARVRAKGFTENVVDFMATKLRRLPGKTRDFLGKLACLGNSGQTATLSMVFGVSEDEIHVALWEVVRTGLISRHGGGYVFLHDRVHEAAYALISRDERVAVHLQIGRILAARTTPAEIDTKIFEIVNQLDRGAALIQSHEERLRVAALNLRAGKRARTSTAYASALTYFAAGRALLDDNYWEQQYRLVFDLELHLAECQFLTGELAPAEERLSALVERAATVVDRAAVTHLRQALYLTLDRPDRAIEVGLEYLRNVGIEWSSQPSEDVVRVELERMWRLLDGRSIEQLIDLPLMSDLGWRATMDVLSGLFAPTLLTNSNLYDLVVLRMTTLSLEHGNCDASCYAYSHINRVLGFRFGDYQTAFRFGQLACDLVQNRGLDLFEARVYASFGAFAVPWMKDLVASRALIRRGFDMANASGDLTYAVFGFKNLITNLVVSGEHLGEVEREAEQGLAYARKARFGFAVDWFTCQLMLIRALRGPLLDFDSPDNAGYGDDSYERHIKEDPPLALCTCTYWIHKLQACVLAEDYSRAMEAVANAAPLLWSTRSFLEAADYHFYGALTRAAACDFAMSEERAQHFDLLLAHHRQLVVWAENCPANFANRAALVGAEIARLEGRDLDAMRLYEEAIRSARENRFLQNEGIAHELASRFYATRDFETIANTYLRNARYCYLRWGADAKVRQLDQLHPHLRGEPVRPSATSTISTPVEQLDLATVVKVSQAVWGETVLEKLIDKLMRTSIEHAGAERGLLILPRGDELRIAAEATTRGNTIVVGTREASAAAAALPESVVHYVVRTQESVILDDASAANPFLADAYIVQHHARSILCLPLINRAKLVGVLYLENNLIPHVFTPARIAVLKLVALQAAISLENTRLYGDLQQREAKIRRLVDANVMGVCIWNLDGGITEANEAFLRMVGHSREDLLSGRVRWRDLTPAEWRDRDEHAVAELRAVAKFQPFEKEFFRKDGSRVPLLIGGALFEEGGNEGVAFVLDLTERKLAENALRESQENLARTEQFSLVMATHTDLEGRWLKVPPTLCKLLGYTEEELLGRRFHEFTHPDDVEAEWAQCSRLARGEFKSFDLEKRYIRKDGANVWVYLNASVVLDVNGAPVHFRTYIRDITQRKQQEQALGQSEERYRTLAETATDVILAIDQTSKILFVNGAVEKAFGYTPAEIVGQKITVLMPQRLRRRHEEAIRRYLESGDKRISWSAVSLPGLHKNGREIDLDVSFAEVGTGDERFFSGILRDVTERKRTEEALRQTQAELAHVARVATLGEMSASIAHEVNQPLAAVVNSAGACLRWLDAHRLQEARRSASRAIAEGRRASEIISRIRALANKAPPQKDWLDVNETIHEVIALARGEMQQNGVALETQLSSDVPIILADRIQLQQVVLNLMMNAIEALNSVEKNGRELLVRSATDKSEHVVISVQDSGPGFDPNRMDLLFDAFYTTKPQGLGMGLAISRTLIEAHGGRLWATANAPRGAVFQFMLPVNSEKLA
ncbi:MULTISPECIES: PAS domain S-box protein [unclassified Sinorhizobium]|uniref:PAS domain S-box protein n=1 Tax=unclassified Sinorhizobium TaxID=2613772 RepID=UPI0024C258DC|nr:MULTISPECIES: PAS domain S-box protein [unclassified Sinorhizobium]MDK1378677.1 PAS domain S-box protein [Sinorhizobium sp. 6-70]MDK1480745.1 PAS domain S-box protein [Sinorhizobium sp. 6-117]